MNAGPGFLATYFWPMKFLVAVCMSLATMTSFAQDIERTCYCIPSGRLCFVPLDSVDLYKLYELNKQQEWKSKGSFRKRNNKLEYLHGTGPIPWVPYRIGAVKKDRLILYEEGCVQCGGVTRYRFIKCNARRKKNIPPLPVLPE